MGKAWVPDESYRIVIRKKRGWIGYSGYSKAANASTHTYEHTHTLTQLNRISAARILSFTAYFILPHHNHVHTTRRTSHYNTEQKKPDAQKYTYCISLYEVQIQAKSTHGGSGWISPGLWGAITWERLLGRFLECWKCPIVLSGGYTDVFL